MATKVAPFVLRSSWVPQENKLYSGVYHGGKPIYLPNFVLTLLRTPALPANFASFIVPLNLNKLDLRDYLYHAYGIKVHGVRSYIQLQKLRQDRENAKRPKPRRWHRPRSIKRMLVEMEKPFVWPRELAEKEMEPWDPQTHKAALADQEALNASIAPDARQKPSTERGSIAEQAKAILEGRSTWRSTRSSLWEDIGREVEVEQDMEISPAQDEKSEKDR